MKETIVKYRHAIIALIMILLNSVGASASTPWSVNPSDYRYDMSLYLDVTFSESGMDYSLYDVGVFYGEECRGIAEILPLGDGKNCLYLRVRSNQESGETMTFRYHEIETGKIFDMDGISFTFESNGRLGYPSDPYILRIGKEYDVIFSAGKGGTIDHEGGRFDEGTEITVTATPDEGYHFERWSDESTENPRTITATGHLHLSAEFAPNTYRLTLYLNDEYYSSEEVEFGTTLDIQEPQVPEGYRFDGWTTEVPETMPAYDLDIYGTYSYYSSISAINITDEEKIPVYSISGILLFKDKKWSDIVDKLENGLYIINGQKVIVLK